MAVENRDLVDLDDSIINLVRERPHLYKISRGDYRDTEKRDNSFKEIAEKLNLSVEEVRKRWKCLRDQYTREKRRLRLKTGASEKSSKWAIMSFLDDFIIPRKSFENCLINESEGIEVEQDDSCCIPSTSCEEIVIEEGPGYERSCNTPLTTSPCQADAKPTRQMTTSSKDLVNVVADIGKVLCQSLSSEEQEEEVFCASVSHCLKRFSPQKKSLAKLKIQQLLYEIESGYSLEHFHNHVE